MRVLSLREYKVVRISVPWGHIAGRWYGNRDERPILAIHGWLENLGTYDKLLPLLPEHIGVLAIDMPGHGLSSQLPQGMRYFMCDYVLIIPRIMKEYNWKTVSLMGHSMGSTLSFFYAALRPQTVDMLISLDCITSPEKTIEDVDIMPLFIEKYLIEEERSQTLNLVEPPSYTSSQLCKMLQEATNDSVPQELAPHLLYRGVAKSQMYPEKFYFSRDARLKVIDETKNQLDVNLELANRLKGIPHLLIRGEGSPFASEEMFGEVLLVLQENPLYECYDVQGMHHAHLTNAAECAKYIAPFLRKYRPPTVDSWSLEEEQMPTTLNSNQSSQEELRFRGRTKSKL